MNHHTPRTKQPQTGAPPSDSIMERGLISSCHFCPRCLDEVAEIVSGADFFDADLGHAFDVMLTGRQAGVDLADTRLLLCELKGAGVANDLASMSFLAGCFREGISTNAVPYARRIRKLAILRRQQQIGYDLARRAGEDTSDPGDLRDLATAELDASIYSEQSGPEDVAAVAERIVTDLRQPERAARPVFTGFASVDSVAGGFQPGELVVLAARPGVGKTALALQVAHQVAQGRRTALFASLEMSAAELTRRLLSSVSRLPATALRGGGLDVDELERVADAGRELDDLPLRIWAPSSATVGRIGAMARREAARGELGLVVVDYVGLVRADDPRRQRYEQVAAVSAALKALAKDLSIPVLCLAQLNRQAEGAVPRLAHLRESGSLEQDADIVLFVHRDENKPDEAAAIIAKHRHGDTGRLTLRWRAEQTRFEDPTEPDFEGWSCPNGSEPEDI